MTTFRSITAALWWTAFLTLTPVLPAADESVDVTTGSDEVSYYRQIRPIFQARCQGCHQPAKSDGSYVMTDFARLLRGGESELPAVVAQKPDESYLLDLIEPVDGEAEMPKNGKPLAASEIALVRRWIEQGARNDTPANALQRYDADHPPVYTRPPVVSALDYAPDGSLLAEWPEPGTIELEWDAASCPAADYNLLYGDLAAVGSYSLDGSECAIGTSGSFTWTGVPAGSLYFLVVGVDGLDTESSWGRDNSMIERNGAAASSECGATEKDPTYVCH